MKTQLLVSFWLLLSSFNEVSSQNAGAITFERDSKTSDGVSVKIKSGFIGEQTQLAPIHHINSRANTFSAFSFETLKTTSLAY